jgi:3-hydroxyisobutyrate dehydrogenase
MNKPRVAFFGLGIMGAGMARQLLTNGFPLAVFNRNREKSKPFAAEGAQVAGSPKEAAAQADVIISMVSDDVASRSLWLGENGALAAAKPGALCIECSTLSVNWVHELAAAAAARGCELLDAPVTGSKPQAASGELSFLVGGSAATLEKARPVLSVMSKVIFHLGPTGSGALVKVINNFLCGVQTASFAEALAIVERSGLDRAKALEMMTSGAAGSPIVKTMAVRMTSPDEAPNFLLRLIAKDLGYAIEEGKKVSVELVTAAAALEDFKKGIAAGHGEKDLSAVVKPLLAEAKAVRRVGAGS